MHLGHLCITTPLFAHVAYGYASFKGLLAP